MQSKSLSGNKEIVATFDVSGTPQIKALSSTIALNKAPLREAEALIILRVSSRRKNTF